MRRIVLISILILISGCAASINLYLGNSISSSHAYVTALGKEFVLSQRFFGDASPKPIEFCREISFGNNLDLHLDCEISSETSQKIISLIDANYQSILSNQQFISSNANPDLIAKRSCVYLVQKKVSFRMLREIDDCFHIYFSYEGYFDSPRWRKVDSIRKEYLFLAGIFGTLSHERFHFYFNEDFGNRSSAFQSYDKVGEEFLGNLEQLTMFYNIIVSLNALLENLPFFPEVIEEDEEWMIDLCHIGELQRMSTLKEEHPSFLGMFFAQQLVASNASTTQPNIPRYVDSVYHYATSNEVNLETLSKSYCEKVVDGKQTIFDTIADEVRSSRKSV